MKKPIYQIIYEQILNEISKLAPHTVIPSERDLSIKYSASRMTVRKSILNLCNDGYLYRLPNKGTYVADHYVKNKLIDLGFCSHNQTEFINMFYDVKYGNNEIMEELNISHDDPYYRIVRKNLFDNKIVSVEEIYINTLSISPKNFHLANINSVEGVHSIKQKFNSVFVPGVYAIVLEINDSPAILVKTTVKSFDGAVLVYSKHFINSNSYDIEISI